MQQADLDEPLREEQILAQATRIMNSKSLARSLRLRQLFEYLLSTYFDDTLTLNEQLIARHVFGITSGFNSKNSIVRVNVKRLREKLAQYYRESEQDDDIIIALCESSYRLTVSHKQVARPSAFNELMRCVIHFFRRVFSRNPQASCKNT